MFDLGKTAGERHIRWNQDFCRKQTIKKDCVSDKAKDERERNMLFRYTNTIIKLGVDRNITLNNFCYFCCCQMDIECLFFTRMLKLLLD